MDPDRARLREREVASDRGLRIEPDDPLRLRLPCEGREVLRAPSGAESEHDGVAGRESRDAIAPRGVRDRGADLPVPVARAANGEHWHLPDGRAVGTERPPLDG